MTTPDPRTDLAGYLGLTDDQAEDCRRSAPFHPGSVYTKIGARLIEQDQARADEPDDGLISVTDPEPVEGPPGTVPVTLWLDVELNEYGNRSLRYLDGKYVIWFNDDWWRDHGVPLPPDPKPPWKSPLDDLPDLTEEDCKNALWAYSYHPGTLLAQIGRALIAAGWTPEGEA